MFRSKTHFSKLKKNVGILSDKKPNSLKNRVGNILTDRVSCVGS